jgi:hypothetical protein
VLEVVPCVGDTLVSDGHEAAGFGTILRSFLFAGEGFLLAPQVTLGAGDKTRIVCLSAGALDRDVRQADINANDRVRRYDGRKLWNCLAVLKETGREVLSRRCLRQRDGLEFANQFAMHDRLDAARTLGDRDPIVADCDPASAVVTRLRPALALESWEPCVGISGKKPRGTRTKKQRSDSIDNPSGIR